MASNKKNPRVSPLGSITAGRFVVTVYAQWNRRIERAAKKAQMSLSVFRREALMRGLAAFEAELEAKKEG